MVVGGTKSGSTSQDASMIALVEMTLTTKGHWELTDVREFDGISVDYEKRLSRTFSDKPMLAEEKKERHMEEMQQKPSRPEDELQSLDKAVQVKDTQLSQLQGQLQTVSKVLQAKDNELQAVQKLMKGSEDELQTVKKTVQVKETQVSQLQDQLQAMQKLIEGSEGKSNDPKKTIKFLESRIMELEEQVQQLDKLSSEKDTLIEKYKIEYKEDMELKLKKSEQQLLSAKSQLEVEERTKVELQHKLTGIQNEEAQLKVSLQDKEDKLKTVAKISRAKGAEVHKLQNEMQTLKDMMKIKDGELQQLLLEQMKGETHPTCTSTSTITSSTTTSTVGMPTTMSASGPLHGGVSFSPVSSGTCDAVVQADYLALTGDSVQGVELCGQTLLEITGNKQQKVSWESHGFHLTIPEGAVPSGVTVSVAVKAILAGQFVLPEDAQLVSAIYWVSASEMFLKKVSVHIQHCARITSEEEASNYKMIVGKCSQESLPYTFQIRDGIFSPESQLATISVKQFSFFAVIRRWWSGSKFQYMSHCYLKCRLHRPTSWKLRFMITQKLPSWQQLIEEKYKDWEENHPASEIEFELKERTAAGQGGARKFRRREPSILLEVTPAGKNEPKNWDIYSMNFLEIYQESVNRSNVNVGMADIKTCELAIDWKGQLGTALPVLRRRINLVGAENPKNFTLRICPPTAAAGPTITSTRKETAPSASAPGTLPDGSLDEDDLKEIVAELEDINDVEGLGLNLGLRMSAVEQIMTDYQLLTRQKAKVIYHWLKRRGIVRQNESELPTWAALAESVASLDLPLSKRIRDKHCSI